MRILRRVSALIIGLVFFISGILKLMDPVGAGLVMQSYLSFLHLDFIINAADYLGVSFALAESLCGASLITGVWKKATAMFSALLLGFFTLLTLALVIFNPSMDCGCFGEAVHLTHMQSLLKNIALCLVWVLAFIPFSSQEKTRNIKYVGFTAVAVMLLLFLLYSSLSVPLHDFTKFKPGAEIMLADEIDADDTTSPTISFSGADGDYADSLIVTGSVIAFSVPDPEKVSDKRWGRIEKSLSAAEAAGYTPLLLVCSTPEDIEKELPSQRLLSAAYFADRKDLLTLNRSNGGATYIDDGQVIAKWSANSLPGRDKLSALRSAGATEALVAENNGPKMKLGGFLLITFAAMLLL